MQAPHLYCYLVTYLCNYHWLLFYNATDYGAGPYTVQFSRGDTMASFQVGIVDDINPEVNETFILAINSSLITDCSGISVGNPNQARVTILD